jgi:hypothetical protein
MKNHYNLKLAGQAFRTLREHFGETRAAVSSWEVEAKRRKPTKESCGRGEFSWSSRAYKYVIKSFDNNKTIKWPYCSSWESARSIVSYLTERNLDGKFVEMCKKEVLSSDPRCDVAVQVVFGFNVSAACSSMQQI